MKLQAYQIQMLEQLGLDEAERLRILAEADAALQAKLALRSARKALSEARKRQSENRRLLPKKQPPRIPANPVRDAWKQLPGLTQKELDAAGCHIPVRELPILLKCPHCEWTDIRRRGAAKVVFGTPDKVMCPRHRQEHRAQEKRTVEREASDQRFALLTDIYSKLKAAGKKTALVYYERNSKQTLKKIAADPHTLKTWERHGLSVPPEGLFTSTIFCWHEAQSVKALLDADLVDYFLFDPILHKELDQWHETYGDRIRWAIGGGRRHEEEPRNPHWSNITWYEKDTTFPVRTPSSSSASSQRE